MPGPRFQHLAADGLYNVLHPIEEGVVVEVAEGPGVHPNRRAIIVYPIVKILHVETVFDEFGAPAVQIVRVEKDHYGELFFSKLLVSLVGDVSASFPQLLRMSAPSPSIYVLVVPSRGPVTGTTYRIPKLSGAASSSPRGSCVWWSPRNQARLARRLISLSQLAKPIALQRGRAGWEITSSASECLSRSSAEARRRATSTL